MHRLTHRLCAQRPARPGRWPKYRFRSGPPQILISKFRGAAANFEVDFDCQNTSVLPQDRAYRRRTPTQDIPPLNRTRSPPHETRLERAGAHESAFGGVGSAERYWRRDRASLGCVCRPSARGCADIATPARLSRSLDPFAARGRRPRVRGGWRPGALRRHLVGSACGAESYSSALGPDPSAELCNAGIQTQED